LIFSCTKSKPSVLLLCVLVISARLWSQDTISRTPSSRADSQLVVAGPQYEKSSFHKKLMGAHYRQEWTTPVKVKVVSLDTIFGGLKPVRSGGRQQTNTLHLVDKDGKPYVMRSVDKTYTGSMPGIVSGTFVEHWANDQVSTLHPYAALTVPPMAEAAGVYHTRPQIVFIPRQPLLDSFNEQFGDALYLLEERPDGDQSEAPHFGSSEDVISTNKLFYLLSASHKHVVDQKSFVRARLFDLFLSDWGRHEDQWRWASFEQDSARVYQPIPRDRDQIYTRFDGLIVSLATSVDELEHLQSFDSTIKDIEEYNAPARHLDRRFTNQLVWEDWLVIARDLQQKLTDSIIEVAVHQLPPEIFPISGEKIIASLKGRRNRLVDFAKEYYSFLAKDVDIAGSLQRERFEVKPVNKTQVKLSIYQIDSTGNVSSRPYYTRVFQSKETKEIRIYGLGGEDQYVVDKHLNDDFLVRIIGGVGVDSFAKVSGAEKETGDVVVYDDKDSKHQIPAGLKKRLSDNIYNHFYDYRAFAYDNKGTVKSLMYNRRDRVYARFGYQIQRQHWRKYPFGFDHTLYTNFSLSQGAFSFGYEGIITQFPGNWNLLLNANYDAVVDVHFFGVGNETERSISDDRYYRLRRRDFIGSIGLGRNFWSYHQVNIHAYYNYLDFIIDKNTFVDDHFSSFKPENFERKHYVGLHANYLFEKWDDPVLPTRGAGFSASVSTAHNLKEQDLSVVQYMASMGFSIPLMKQVSLNIKAGGASLEGKPEFFQLNYLGGSRLLRGYVRERFYGKTVFSNANELQWARDFKSFFWNGKIGLIAHYDLGRVWMPDEESSIWHAGYGGGVILVPFNKMTFAATYSFSKEDRVLHIRVGRFFEGQMKKRYILGAP
jgi:hypothetical protein